MEQKPLQWDGGSLQTISLEEKVLESLCGIIILYINFYYLKKKLKKHK